MAEKTDVLVVNIPYPL